MAFELWRQDDHGHRFRSAVFSSRSQAEEKMRHLMLVPHKQMARIARDLAQAINLLLEDKR